MRQVFFISMLIIAVVATLAYFLWSVVTTLYRDWYMGKDVDKIKAESAVRRARRLEEASRRLENGCDHSFGEMLGGFPPNACFKCGLERERPVGACDHVWRAANEPIPCSYCEKCGRKYVSPLVNP